LQIAKRGRKQSGKVRKEGQRGGKKEEVGKIILLSDKLESYSHLIQRGSERSEDAANRNEVSCRPIGRAATAERDEKRRKRRLLLTKGRFSTSRQWKSLVAAQKVPIAGVKNFTRGKNDGKDGTGVELTSVCQKILKKQA